MRKQKLSSWQDIFKEIQLSSWQDIFKEIQTARQSIIEEGMSEEAEKLAETSQKSVNFLIEYSLIETNQPHEAILLLITAIGNILTDAENPHEYVDEVAKILHCCIESNLKIKEQRNDV